MHMMQERPLKRYQTSAAAITWDHPYFDLTDKNEYFNSTFCYSL